MKNGVLYGHHSLITLLTRISQINPIQFVGANLFRVYLNITEGKEDKTPKQDQPNTQQETA
jgi:hypothetical protein